MSLGHESWAVHAVVQTGSSETSYRRAGRGTPVLLLLDAGTPWGGGGLFRSLARTFRVIEPTVPPPVPVADLPAVGAAPPGPMVPPGEDSRVAWLSGVIDGLGLDRPVLLVTPALAPLAESFARLDPHRCGPVVVARPESGSERLVAEITESLHTRHKHDPEP